MTHQHIEGGGRVYATEAEAAADFDAIMRNIDLFTSYDEVPGTLLQPRPGQIDKGVRIDRILVPNAKLIDAGWRHGIVGVEIKKDCYAFGPYVAQAMDYTRSAFRLGPGNFNTICDYVFIWPIPAQHGPIASIMAQNRVGSAMSWSHKHIQFKCGENNILDADIFRGNIRIGASIGAKVGSR